MISMLEVAPHAEAMALIKDKPAVVRAVFDRLLPDIRARVFTITGIEDANMLQEIRDIIAELPQGRAWDDVKQDVVARLEASPWFNADAAEKRAELLMRQHGFMAYAACQYEADRQVRDDFPFWQYLSMDDEAVRDSHAKLHGLILPVDHPFWEDHYPPWDWGCRCTVRPMTAEEAEEEVKRGKGRRPGPHADERLRAAGTLDLGDGHPIDVRTPKQRAAERGEDPASAWAWTPGDLRLPLQTLASRYDAQVWARFHDYTRQQFITGPAGERYSVWEWLFSAEREKAMAYVLQRGADKEMVTAIDARTGRRIGGELGGKKQANVLPLLAQARKQKVRISLVHNHPSGGMLSPEDVLICLQHDEVAEVVACTDGAWYKISRPNGIKVGNKKLKERLEAYAHRNRAGKLPEDEWLNELSRLNGNGVIDYDTYTKIDS